MKPINLLLTTCALVIVYVLVNLVTIAQPGSQPQAPVTATPADDTASESNQLLTPAAISDCEVSLPNLTESPDEYYMSVDAGYSNPERTLFIGLWPGGKVIFHPDGAGSREPDGSLAMKFWFYRTVPGEVVIEGRRLDVDGPVARLATLRGPADGYGETGFHPAGLYFPDQGCWEVTASAGGERMTFVTLVLSLDFDPLVPNWLPESLLLEDVDVTGYPQHIAYIFRDEQSGELRISTAEEVVSEGVVDGAVERQLQVNNQRFYCAQGKRVGQRWAADADATELRWTDAERSYQISQEALGLTCQDLLKVVVPE